MAKETKIVFGLFFIFTIGLISSRAQAETYGPVSFMLPPNWECTLEKSSDVCVNEAERSSIALVVTYKMKTADDSIEFYKKQLGVPRPVKTGNGTIMSQLKFIHEIQLNGQTWLEALHHNSEIRGFYTDYLVTVAGPYAVLISVTVSDALYPSELNALKPTIESLKIALPENQPAVPQPSQQNLSQTSQSPAQNVIQQQRSRHLLLYLAIGLIAAVFLLIYAIMK